ncbi:MAG: hypothetical protein LBQ90_09885 [Synergistaceae bacterium]|jgi:hypothetical protein|nr:hypothetical protein [Synergistaceae bacterium]
MKQIHEKGYADKYAEMETARSTTQEPATQGSATRGSTTRGSTTLIGLAVDRAARKVGGYRIERLRP